VPQLYVGRPDGAPVPMAVRALAGFERVELAPGEAREIVMQLPPRQLSYWNKETGEWEFVPGERAIHVGASSRDLRLNGTVSPTS